MYERGRRWTYWQLAEGKDGMSSVTREADPVWPHRPGTGGDDCEPAARSARPFHRCRAGVRAGGAEYEPAARYGTDAEWYVVSGLVLAMTLLLLTPAFPASAAHFGYRPIEPGMQGEDVYILQETLNELGYYPGPPDERFGPLTLTAVKAFQAAHRLPPTGIVTGDTMDLLMQARRRDVTVRLDGRGRIYPGTRLSWGRLMVPVRTMATDLGASVLWNAEAHAAEIRRGDTLIVLSPARQHAEVNGRPVEMGSPPVIIENRLFASLRFLADALGAGVEWQATTRQVVVRTRP